MSEVGTRKRTAKESGTETSGSPSSKRLRVAHTCEWIEQEPAFSYWTLGAFGTSPTLWINGPAGCGKTFLAEHIVNVISAKPEQPSTACFYCHENTAPSKILRSILEQVAADGKTSETDSYAISQALEGQPFGQEPAADELNVAWDRFSLAVQSISQFNLVLDGVDELPSTSLVRNEFNLLQRLVQLAVGHSARMKLCLLSRNQPLLRNALSAYPTIVLTAGKLEDDVRRFALALVSEHRNLMPYRDQIADALVQGAEGIFIWVQLSVQALSLENTRSDILQRLQSLPRALDDLYADLITKKSAQLKRPEIQTRDAILRWTVTAIRPLLATELANAISVSTNTFISDIESRMIDFCGPLIKVESGFVTTVHHSFRDFLRSSHEGLVAISDIKSDSAHTSIAIACLKYLSHPAFTQSIDRDWVTNARATSDYSFLEYASLYWVYHVSEAGSPTPELRELVQNFFDKPNAFSWADGFLPAMISRSVLSVPPRPKNAARFAYLFMLKSQLASRFQSEEKAALDQKISTFLSSSYEKSLAHATEKEGRESIQALERILDLGEVCGWLPGQRSASESLFAEGLGLVRQLDLANSSDDDSVSLAIATYQAQADALKRGGKYEDARDLLMQLVEIIYRQLQSRERDSKAIFAFDSLGWVEMRLGQLDDAATHLEQALQLASTIYGSTSPMTLRSKMTLAEVLHKVNRADEAEHLCQDLIFQLREHSHNGLPLPRDSVSQINILAGVFMAQNKFRDAADTYNTVVEDRKRMFGDDHPMTLWATMQLGLARDAASDDRNSIIALFKDLLPRQEKVLGADHPDVRTSQNALEKLTDGLS